MAMEAAPSPAAKGSTELDDLEQTLRSLREESEVAHVLLGLSAALAEVKSVEETLELAIKLIPTIFGGHRCFAVRDTRDAFAMLAHRGYDGAAVSLINALAVRPDGFPILREAIATKEPILISDVVADG